MEATDSDPYNYGGSDSSYTVNINVKTEIKSECGDEYSNVCVLELDECDEGNQDQIEFNSSDAVFNPKTGRFVCVHCLEEIENDTLMGHMVTSHNYRRMLLKCQNCGGKFQERDSLILHRKNCSQPQQKKRKKKTFQQILRKVESDIMNMSGDEAESVSCPICVLELPKFSLKDHLLSVHKNPEVQALNCMKCSKLFKTKLTLREHVRMVHESIEDSVECDLCGQKFCSVKYMNNHKRNVHPSGDKVYECEFCGKAFKSYICLHQHVKSVHPPESASASCPHCPKTFKSKINLRQHLNVLHGARKK